MNNDIEVVSNNQSNPSKRQYLTKDAKQHLHSFDKLSFNNNELRKLGVLRPQVKEQYVEIVSRANYQVIKQLRDNPEEVRAQDWAVISNMATQRLIELEQQAPPAEKIDWSKISREAFERPDSDANTPRKAQ